MKSYNGLYDRMMEHSEIEASIEEAAEHRGDRQDVVRALENKSALADKIHDKIDSDEWSPPVHQKHLLVEGSHKKKREIVKPRWNDEQIVHHMLIRQLRPIIEPRLYKYVFGSLPKRGPHKAVKCMEKWRDDYDGKRFYVFEGDVKKFYDNVDVDILNGKLNRRIRDKKYLRVLNKVVYTTAPGLPKGFYTSPWLANLYMEEFDNFVVQELKPDHYLRYMDNIFIFHRNKKELRVMVKKIIKFLREELHLSLNENWQIFRFEEKNRRAAKTSDGREKTRGRAVNALGFVIHNDRITVRKSVLKRVRAKANHIHKKKRYILHDCYSMLSRIGVLGHAKAYNYYKEHIKPKVSIHYCKRRVSLSSLALRGAC